MKDSQSNLRLLALICLSMVAFAGNSLLCRAALNSTGIDAGSFTTLRLVSAAGSLWLLVWLKNPDSSGSGNWVSALSLFAYAAGFSFAYVKLSTASGALLLFAAVQATMVGYGVCAGEGLHCRQIVGLVLACGGLVELLLPGLSAPPVGGALLMLGAGVAWGVYSLRGREAGDPTRVTAGNFLRAVPLSLGFAFLFPEGRSLDAAGVVYALISGALASGLGYAIWYTALPFMKSTSAATVQLSVPLLAALGAVLFLGEPITLRLVVAGIFILGGITLVTLVKRPLIQSATGP